MKRVVALLVLLAFLVESPPLQAIDTASGVKVHYVSGTDPTLSRDKNYEFFDDNLEELAIFVGSKARLTIPYTKVTRLAYGQNVTSKRRVLFGLLGVWGFFLKNRHQHFLTVEYFDPNGKRQSVIFEVGKDDFWSTVGILQFRSGRGLDYLDDNARRAAGLL